MSDNHAPSRVWTAPRPAWVLAFLLLACVAGDRGSAAAGSHQGPQGRDDPFLLVLDEGFDTPTLDPRLWSTCYWWDRNGCTNLSSANLNWYLPRNVSIEDGVLVLTARREKVKGWKGRTFPYTSGMVTTGGLYADRKSRSGFRATYGFFEIRAKIPSGRGLWPAFWMLPSSRESLPEIDIMEVLGHDPSLLELHYHHRNRAGDRESAGREVSATDLSRDWHVYGVDWSPDRIVWYLDGQEVWRFSERDAIPDEPMYLLINLAVGGTWPGDPDSTTTFPARFEIDYVRVWQRP